MSVHNQITGYRQYELELARCNRALHMFSACNEVFLRATDEKQLLTDLCRVAVELGGYRMAWVGYAEDDDARTIAPQTSFGDGAGCLESIRLSWSTGHDPAGRTIRDGMPVVCEDIAQEPSFFPWLESALCNGVGGLICLPLRNNDKTFGLLGLVTSQPHHMGADEASLLQQLANDLAYGISQVREQSTARAVADVGNQEIKARLRQQAGLLDQARDAIILRGLDHHIIYWNKGAERLYGWTSAEALGRAQDELLHCDPAQFQEGTENVLVLGEWTAEVKQQRRDGTNLIVECRLTLMLDDRGSPQSILAINTDISERKAAEHEIQHLAFHDPLTKLPNRLLLTDRLQQAMAVSSRSGHAGALLFIDLDHFKTLNDTLGHDKGDLLLQQVADRLRSCVRESDTVARLGGDEFVILQEGLSEHRSEAAAQAGVLGGRVLASFAHAFLLEDYEYFSTPSIGITLFQGHEDTVGELLKRADLAMYQAKASGRNALRFFDPQMQAAVDTRVELEADLRRGLQANEFRLYYQPQVDEYGRMTGVEALLRWDHPRRGFMLPAWFIPLAEDTGQILPLGQWVLEAACTQLAQWAKHPLASRLEMAVNISARQFYHPDFVSQVLAVIEHTGAKPSLLKLELTESLLLTNYEDIIGKMSSLKRTGICFSLDDFGTGYSSLAYLKRLPLDQLKIDKSFVQDILTDPNDAAIATTIVALAQSLGLSVIAEGVESEEQLTFLAVHGCNAYQGYLFSPPLPMDELEQFMLTNC